MPALPKTDASPATIALGFGHPVNPGVFGANDMLTDGDDVLHNEAYRALVSALNPTLLRFPGGSHASFWDWEKGHYIPVEEITRIWPISNHNWMLKHHPVTNALPEGTFAPGRIARVARELGIEMQWVPNVTTRPDDQPAFFESLKAGGFDVKYVEMDNETYFWGAEFGADHRGDLYARRAMKLSAVIRALYPEVKIGVVTEEDDFFEEDNPQVSGQESRPKHWNEAFTTLEHRDSYDAVILHHYLMKKGRLDPYTTDRDRAVAFLAYPQVTLERAGPLIRKRFGDKRMWITEFNVIAFYPQFAGDSLSDRWMVSRRDTGWAALYQASFWLTGLCHPESIGILNHHSLAGIDIGWGLGDKHDAQSGYFSKSGQLYAHLSHLARHHDRMHALTIEGVPELGVSIEGETGIPALFGAALTSPGKTTVLLMNRSETPRAFVLADPGRDHGPARLTTYHAEEPEPGPDRVLVHFNSGTPVWEQGPMKPDRAEATIGHDGKLSAKVPPFSLMIVEIGPRT